MTGLRALGAVVFLGLAGHGVVRLILGGRGPFSAFGAIPLSIGAGLGALAVLGNAAMLCGLGWGAAVWGLGAFSVIGLASLARGFGAVRPAEAPRPFSPREWLLVAAVLFGAGAVLLLSVSFPMHYWDSRAIWGAKAKMLFYGGTVFSPEFMDPARVNPHFRYPLLFPMAQAFVCRAAGLADDRAAMPLVGLFFPLLLSFWYETARAQTRSREAALAATALVAVLPVFFMTPGSAYSGYADTALAMLFCLSFGVTLRWRQDQGLRLLLLSAFLTALLPLTKNEGWGLAALSLLLVAWPDRAGLKSSLRAAAFHAAVLLAVAAPWLLIARRLALDPTDGNDIFQLGLGSLSQAPGRLPGLLAYGFKALIGLRGDAFGCASLWGGLWPLFALSTGAAAAVRCGAGLRLSAAVASGFGLLLAAYAVIPGADQDFLTSNFFRVTQALVPLAALQIAVTLDALGFGQPAVGTAGAAGSGLFTRRASQKM